jgi:hypothetical protein
MAAGEAKHGIPLVMDLFVGLPEHVQAGVNEENAKGGNDPVKPGHKRSTRCDHEPAHHERAKDAPGQDAMLHLFVHLEGTENNQKNEEVIDAQRFFDDVARQVFQAALLAGPAPDEVAEQQSQGNPNCAPTSCFANFDFVGLAVENTQIQGDGDEDENIEPYPQQRGAHGQQDNLTSGQSLPRARTAEVRSVEIAQLQMRGLLFLHLDRNVPHQAAVTGSRFHS